MFDSNGPSVRIRGNAFQVHEKYLGLARDATSSGDRIAAENYYQHAEHYFRIHSADLEDRNQRQNLTGQSSEGQRHGDGQRHAEGQRHQGGRDQRTNGRNNANGGDGGHSQNGAQRPSEVQPQTEIKVSEPPAAEAAPPKPRRRKPAAPKTSRRPAPTNGDDSPAGD